LLDSGEGCDDGNLVGGDGCDEGCTVETDCPSLPLPESSCLTATRQQLMLKNTGDPSKNRLTWRWTTEDSVYQVDLGAPDDDTKYTLCVYDTTGAVPSLATRVDLANGWPPWTSNTPKGWSYKDKNGSTDGVQKLQIRTSYVGRASAKLSAKGANLPLSSPISGVEYFDQDPNVIVQLLSSEGLCWTAEFATSIKNDGAQFKAKAP
jgi:cysteine-rich repeat protein